MRIKTGRFYDGTLEAPRTNVIVTIDKAKIAAIEPAGDGAKADREAAAITPGLINAHAHLEMNGEPQTLTVFIVKNEEQRLLSAVASAQKALRSGVTALRDLGSSARNNVEVRNAIRAGLIEGPTVVAAAKAICMTGGHGWWFDSRQADGPWDVRKAVREQFKAGADCIKMIATGGVLTPGAVVGNDQLSEEEMRAGILEAKTHGMRVAAHAIGANGIKNAIRAGVTSIEHGSYIDEEGIALMKQHGTTLVPTLNALMGIIENASAFDIPQYAIDKAKMVGEQLQANVLRARKAGVRIAGGSDAGTPCNKHEDYGREIELMTSMLEMTPHEALNAATEISGDLLGINEGVLKPGAPADLLLLDDDLERTVLPLKRPFAVIKAGNVVFQRA
ncbi:MAG TPA: amidohydrolase family protein [Candidatus Acidoferrales bacterium]|nr:amidohydrolase family protein [Candidatus Acidoferrales bacterium]